MLNSEQFLFSQMFYMLKVQCEIFWIYLLYEADNRNNHWINLLAIENRISHTGVNKTKHANQLFSLKGTGILKTSERSCNPSNLGEGGSKHCLEKL